MSQLSPKKSYYHKPSKRYYSKRQRHTERKSVFGVNINRKLRSIERRADMSSHIIINAIVAHLEGKLEPVNCSVQVRKPAIVV